MKRLLLGILWCSIAMAIFLAFGWHALVSGDPASALYEGLAKSTMTAFFAALAALLVMKARRGGAR